MGKPARMEWTCGQPTRSGKPCRWHNPPCPHHGARNVRTPEAAADIAPVATSSGSAVDAAIAARDLHEVAWTLLARESASDDPNKSLLSTLIRVLASLGPAPLDDEQALAEASLRGVLMNGLAPRNPEEWALAESIFDAPTLADLRQREATESRFRSHQ